MPADNEYISTLDTAAAPTNEAPCHALEQVHFWYHGAIGELIWVMIISCCPEVCPQVIEYDFIILCFVPVVFWLHVIYR